MKGSTVVTAGLDYAKRKENFSRSYSIVGLGTQLPEPTRLKNTGQRE